MPGPDRNITGLAVLGQLGLRDWSAYELTRSMRRTLHWFWPRAESGIYAEARRLEAEGLARSRPAPAADGSRRSRRVYSITASGRRRLRAWLSTPPETVQMYVEPFLRVHLARAGELSDLMRTVDTAEDVAEELLATAVTVAEEFLGGRHVFQDDLALRGLLFDGLWRQGLALHEWARETRTELSRWSDLDGDAEARARARSRMTEAVEHAASLGIGGQGGLRP